MNEMKKSTQTILCTCKKCKTETSVSLIGAPIEKYYCEKCKEWVSDFDSRPLMIPSYTREYNSFTDGLESW